MKDVKQVDLNERQATEVTTTLDKWMVMKYSLWDAWLVLSRRGTGFAEHQGHCPIDKGSNPILTVFFFLTRQQTHFPLVLPTFLTCPVCKMVENKILAAIARQDQQWVTEKYTDGQDNGGTGRNLYKVSYVCTYVPMFEF